jgi:osmotically inducible protein OsmC
MAMRRANAVWQGGLKDGRGNIKLTRPALELRYSFPSRFEEGEGTSPEDLIGAAHAACFSMALSGGLEKVGFKPDRIETTATVTLETLAGAPTISRIELNTRARVPNIDEKTFQQQVEQAKENCPVSRLYKGAQITATATLE